MARIGFVFANPRFGAGSLRLWTAKGGFPAVGFARRFRQPGRLASSPKGSDAGRGSVAGDAQGDFVLKSP